MSQAPQRPYVPHRTSTRGQPAIAPADFALAKPFVPGAQHPQSVVVDMAATSGTPLLADAPIASIETFLAAPRTSAPMPPVDLARDDVVAEEPEELPPLEHFLDPLPPISDFSTRVADDVPGRDFPDESVEPQAQGESDWVATDWQRYDWQSVAALGDAERAQAEASNAWATTDWEVSSPRKTESSETPADAIALALDRIAERIRSGDLSLPGGGAVADPATIAATLAALLGVRR